MTSRRWILVVATTAVVGALTLVALWRPRATPDPVGGGAKPPTLNPPSTATLNGVDYELPWVADATDYMAVAVEFLKARTETGFRWSNGTHTVKVVNAFTPVRPLPPTEITLNGTNYGRVASGDHVRLTPNGVLYVNGVERKPN